MDRIDLGWSVRTDVRLAAPGSSPKQWTLRLYDPANGGLLDDLPYALSVTIEGMTERIDHNKVVADPPQPPWSRLTSDDTGGRPTQACRLESGPIRPRLNLKPIRRVALRDIPGDGSKLVLAAASGRRIYARLVGDIADARTALSFFAASAKKALCSVTALPRAEYAVAEQPWDFLEQTWRVEVSGGTAPTGYIELYREDAPGLDTSLIEVDRIAPFECISFGAIDRRRFHPTPRAPNQFQAATSLTLRFHDTTGDLTSSGLSSIHRATLEALALWRRVCTRCSSKNLAVVSVDDNVFYLDELLAELAPGEPNFLEELPSRSLEARQKIPRRNSGSPRVGSRTPTQRYVPLQMSEAQRANACSAPASGVERFIDFRQTPVCRRTKVANRNEMKVDFVFVDGATGCGDAVGCWNANGVIQFDAKNYKYYIDDTSNILVGRGQIAVDLMRVLAHETGHWIGLDHMDSPFGLMSEYYEETRCIDDATYARLNSIVAGEVEVPVRATGEALRYRRPDP